LNGIARMPAEERAQVFAETADRKALPEAIIEKDFWVLLDTEATVLDRGALRAAPLQRRHLSVENLSRDKPFLRGH